MRSWSDDSRERNGLFAQDATVIHRPGRHGGFNALANLEDRKRRLPSPTGVRRDIPMSTSAQQGLIACDG
jgi:hypothetical protein